MNLPSPGQAFGRYTIVRKLGQGAMGVVYEAHQSTLHRTVALKVLSPELSDSPEYRERFTREAAILARLESRHVITVYDAGEEDGALYIATQYLDGGDLAALVRTRGQLDTMTTLDLMEQVAQGLEDAHAAGVLHRDIKPSNVLLRQLPDGRLHASVCDLGIAATEGQAFTRHGQVLGTLGYMAPERHEGHPATAAGDVYSVGCMLWACLTGKVPYNGTDYEVARGHLAGPLPQFESGAPGAAELNALLQYVLAKDPAQRCPSASQLRQEIVRTRDSLTRPTEATMLRPAAVPATDTVVRPPVPVAPVAPVAQHVTVAEPAVIAPAPPAPARRLHPAVLVAGILALVLVAVGATAFALKGEKEAAQTTAAPTTPPATTPTAPVTSSGPSADDPLGIGYPRRDLSCTGESIVVLTSSPLPPDGVGEMRRILDRFTSTDAPASYLSRAASCPNLGRTADKGELDWVPFLGPFSDTREACDERMEHADTTTYVAAAESTRSTASWCACAYEISGLPALNVRQDAEPVGNNRFWVLEMQYMLNKAGFNPERLVPGKYGARTAAMVADLQSASGVYASGEVDTATWSALLSRVC